MRASCEVGADASIRECLHLAKNLRFKSSFCKKLANNKYIFWHFDSQTASISLVMHRCVIQKN